MNRIEEYNIDSCPDHGFDGVEYIERTDKDSSFVHILCSKCGLDSDNNYNNSVNWRFRDDTYTTAAAKIELITEWNVNQANRRKDNENK